jgi:hypothetical protein
MTHAAITTQELEMRTEDHSELEALGFSVEKFIYEADETGELLVGLRFIALGFGCIVSITDSDLRCDCIGELSANVIATIEYENKIVHTTSMEDHFADQGFENDGDEQVEADDLFTFAVELMQVAEDTVWESCGFDSDLR